MFRIRIDIVNGLTSDELVEVCKPDTHVIVRHELPHGNPHYHAYFKFDSEIKDNTLRQRIKRGFEHLKSTDYSVKKCNPDRINEYVQYMFNTKHGNRWELIDSRNFDTELLNSLKEAAQAVSDDFAERNPKKSDKPTVYDLAMEIDKVFKAKYHITDNPLDQLGQQQPPEGPLEYEEYLNIAIIVCRRHKQPFEENYLRRLVTTALCERASGRKTIIGKIMAREFFRSY